MDSVNPYFLVTLIKNKSTQTKSTQRQEIEVLINDNSHGTGNIRISVIKIFLIMRILNLT